MHFSPFDSPAVFPGKSIQVELWQRSDARFAALVRERAEMSRPQSSYLQAKRMVLCQCSNVHVETFSENDSECTLEYSVLLAAASLDEAKDELCCILLLLEAETARLFPRILSA
ncbi:hypothetical protein Theco_3613 [Thermobacillus composti KWC4]|uniref:Uncharacterized protein n=1 Tax=Thermobacillus composti (strain DSM 18247 / JCM 13945 / KWC4) TaxID=717605 RepID=L0EJ41_THECK|nr:hypothetical protein [Thermobacillus composti]AGA59639.1 hypothetical protein Theco_3613 [Thermobacillus composti KWC4]